MDIHGDWCDRVRTSYLQCVFSDKCSLKPQKLLVVKLNIGQGSGYFEFGQQSLNPSSKIQDQVAKDSQNQLSTFQYG